MAKIPTTMSWILAIVWILIICTTAVFAVPVQKRQSDQRVAELETLLAMHKYGVGQGSRRVGGRNSPAAGYGLIDFNYIGRRKKSDDADAELAEPQYMKGISEKHLKQILSFPEDLGSAPAGYHSHRGATLSLNSDA